jgi:hypothetical protein
VDIVVEISKEIMGSDERFPFVSVLRLILEKQEFGL